MYHADKLIQDGLAAERAGKVEEAISLFTQANVLSGNQAESVLALQRIAKSYFAQAIATRDAGGNDIDGAITLLVRSLELNPGSDEVRGELNRLLALRPARDLTTECLIHPDAARATRQYREVFQLAIDFSLLNGVPGDYLEFGSLGGWTARQFSELARDSGFLGNVCLFDSFEGLPKAHSLIDAQSPDLTRGVWRENMKLPDSWVEEIGKPFEEHIADRLSTIISRGRIHIHKGFYSETLKNGVPYKAAIIHMDCDLYQSTIEVFEGLLKSNSLQDGVIILFDDWNCNRGNPAYGQRRAFKEFLDENADRWSASPYHPYGHNCTSFILHDLTA